MEQHDCNSSNFFTINKDSKICVICKKIHKFTEAEPKRCPKCNSDDLGYLDLLDDDDNTDWVECGNCGFEFRDLTDLE